MYYFFINQYQKMRIITNNPCLQNFFKRQFFFLNVFITYIIPLLKEIYNTKCNNYHNNEKKINN